MYREYCRRRRYIPASFQAANGQQRKRPPAASAGGPNSPFSLNFLQKADMGDILLIAVLLLLYIDSKDDDFLIILAVVAMSIFGPE